MKEFNSVEFNNAVKNIKEQVKHITSNNQAKLVILQVIKDNDYDAIEVYNYIHSLWKEVYPYYDLKYKEFDWSRVYNHYIKEAEEEADWDMIKKYKDTFESVSEKGTAAQEQLRTKFLTLIEELGMSPKLLEMDMCLDLWGWCKTLDTLVSLASGKLVLSKEKSSSEEEVPMEEATISEETTLPEEPCEKVSPVVEEVPAPEPTTTSLPSVSKTEEKKKGKTRRRPKYLEIQQWSLDGKFIRSWKNISEAAKTLGLNHASISKCASGAYKKAEGSIWKGITDPAELSTAMEVLPAAA